MGGAREREEKMNVLEVTRYGFVWCSSCGKTKPRETDVEPLPLCRNCNEWMEPLLCEEVGCQVEASVHEVGGHFCEFHK